MERDNRAKKTVAIKSLDSPFRAAFFYSIPVFLGYIAIGTGFGLLLVNAGYPAWLAPLMSMAMFAGAAQYIAVGLFASAAGLVEMLLITLIVNARHLAYAFSLLHRYGRLPWYRWYLIFGMTDETFALVASLPEEDPRLERGGGRFLFWLSLLNQSYWVAGSLLGALAGTLLPWTFKGVDFALTALFIVLMLEQVLRIKRALPFILTAVFSLMAIIWAGEKAALLVAILASLLAMGAFEFLFNKKGEEKSC